MAGSLSHLQMTDVTTWKGLTKEAHLGALWLQSPQKVSSMVTTILQMEFGNNIDTILDQFPKMEFEDDRDFEWDLSSQALNNVELVECRIGGTAITAAAQPGRNFTTFDLVFRKNWFSDQEVIVGELNEKYPIRVVKPPVPDGNYWVYTCEMNDSNPDMFIPYDQVTPGRRFSGEFAPVSRDFSTKGRQIRFKSMISMRNAFSKIRIEKHTGGQLSGKKMGSYFLGKDKKPVFFWVQYESYMFKQAFREDINRLYMFGRSNRGKDGKYRPKDPYTGEVIVQGSGMREQMETSNTSYYNAFYIEELSGRLMDLSEGKIKVDQRGFMMRTGERGAFQFHKGIENYTQLFTPNMDQNRIYNVNQNGFQMGKGYGGQFVEYRGPNNMKVNLSVDSFYDDRNRNKMAHPDGGVVESYRYDIFDIGTVDGSPNIQKCVSKQDPYIIHKYIPGMRNPFSPNNEVSAIGTPSDIWSEHKMFTGAICVRDPSRTASFIHNLQMAV